MEFQRILLLSIFSFSIFLLWDGWHRQNQPVPQVIAPSSTPAPSASLIADKIDKQPVDPVIVKQNVVTGEKVAVTTDFFKVEISTAGGDITQIEFLKQFDTTDKSKPFQLFRQDHEHTYIAQSGLLGSNLLPALLVENIRTLIESLPLTKVYCLDSLVYTEL